MPLVIFAMSALAISFMVKVAHTVEESVEGLADYFGWIAGYQIPKWFDWLFFRIGLTVLMVFLSGFGWIGYEEAASVLVGFLLGDFVCSHILWALGTNMDNPGLKTSFAYLIEAVLLIARDRGEMVWALLIPGFLFFGGTIPALKIFGNLFGWKRFPAKPTKGSRLP